MRFVETNGLLTPELLITTTQDPVKISKIPQILTPELNLHYPFTNELQTHLQGKQLLLDELPFSLSQLYEHYLNGYISFRKGILNQNKILNCTRCGNEDPALFASFDCARCHTHCNYCRKCITMGRISECTPLISWTGPESSFPPPDQILTWSGTLSQGQQTASDKVVEAIQNNSNLLVWAVCGAGKTEVLFKGIETALYSKKNVCIATPRTDVVIELAPRIKDSFNTIDVIALYGGSEDRTKTAPITITTTHQLLRYYQAFDVIIIDEVDAFPYSVEPMLQYAVEQAKKKNSTTINLTATPNQQWQRELKKGTRPTVTIPARYHRHPLPVPQFKWCGNWRKHLKKDKLPPTLLGWINFHLSINKQGFLFVPRIDLLEQIVIILKKLNNRIEGVHAEDPFRKEKVTSFRKGEIPILVTTTILERGVTVPNIDVAVLGSEDQIFTESALVQISGRVGRSAKYPTGDIIFYHYGKTKAMLAAKRQIQNMNKEAVEQNLLN
ncbi:DEAD/DEAH box helicase [Bacillus luteolus]|uniref:DEAD/DEAH box helicase n=1 Tax=Litchfieldia luteola TaxID=682179 RepID=A0ABR9QEY5_9BACI|nr:DEAD/DEAH box helicase [Cytobacillus luteolus]MBE4907061.1 DEAD/DEAH box helicase [Cytobacillus luteolus]MBP1943472.1 competence protein ComFA [Cytobacillus luteolus]